MENKEIDHFKMKKIIEESKKASDERYKQSSKTRLMKNIEKKFKTTMIGALARFEEKFGVLWGNNKVEAERTEQEKQFFEIWQSVRTEVLNNGNNQLRAAMEELGQYTVTWDRYKAELILKK